MSRAKPKTKIEREERQLVLKLLHVMYLHEPRRKQPQPETGPKLAVMRRSA